jgi:hypothetical protein
MPKDLATSLLIEAAGMADYFGCSVIIAFGSKIFHYGRNLSSSILELSETATGRMRPCDFVEMMNFFVSTNVRVETYA